jgi:methanogenic corrinoid protein MtbC1
VTDDRAQREAAAAQLRAGARAYAAGAAESLLERSPEIGERLGQRAFMLWQGFLAQRALELAVAVELDETELFLAEMRWSFAAWEAREIDPGELGRAMTCLAETLSGELPAGSWEAARPAVELAIRETQQGIPMPADGMARLGGEGEHGKLALEFLEAALQGESREAVEMVLAPLRSGTPIEDLFERVLLPAEKEMGTLWHLGEIGIGEEHAATETVRTAMTVLWHETPRLAPNGRAAVVGSVADDRHDVGVRAASHLLELAGFRAACLGADMPARDFVQAALDQEASVVVVSATMGVHLPRAGETIRALREALGDVRVIVGGPAFGLSETLAGRLGADAHARSPREAVSLALA